MHPLEVLLVTESDFGFFNSVETVWSSYGIKDRPFKVAVALSYGDLKDWVNSRGGTYIQYTDAGKPVQGPLGFLCGQSLIVPKSVFIKSQGVVYEIAKPRVRHEEVTESWSMSVQLPIWIEGEIKY